MSKIKAKVFEDLSELPEARLLVVQVRTSQVRLIDTNFRVRMDVSLAQRVLGTRGNQNLLGFRPVHIFGIGPINLYIDILIGLLSCDYSDEDNVI